MNKKVFSGSVLALTLIAAGVGITVADDDVDKLVAHARGAAPAAIGADATIVVNDDPSSGGPYVMWKDTDYAHIMIPVE